MTHSDDIVLYTYWRSSASYRVRLALGFKRLNYTPKCIHLIHAGGEHRQPAYLELNPQALVPTLIHQGQVLTQSLAIIEYLDECFPQIPLLPDSPLARARARAIAQAIACDIAPLPNLRVLNHLETTFDATADQKSAWAQHWITQGLDAVESLLLKQHPAPAEARYCIGNEPTVADCCLLPQVYNAQRFGCDLGRWPTIRAICVNLGHNEDIQSARPDKQPDAPEKADTPQR